MKAKRIRYRIRTNLQKQREFTSKNVSLNSASRHNHHPNISTDNKVNYSSTQRPLWVVTCRKKFNIDNEVIKVYSIGAGSRYWYKAPLTIKDDEWCNGQLKLESI
jgi:hypothetical protein